ncbi:hypothetical protein M084_2646 [Bacteroides fragilis str. 3988 T1]|nr:hypothetical protein M084_2646 [Bacteroides fragilis str. 3988 T1]
MPFYLAALREWVHKSILHCREFSQASNLYPLRVLPFVNDCLFLFYLFYFPILSAPHHFSSPGRTKDQWVWYGLIKAF